jgi:hypothetical protein
LCDFLDFHQEAEDMAEKQNVQLYYKLGATEGKNDTMTPKQFSQTFNRQGVRTKWVAAVTEFAKKPESEHYEGLYLRWLYPGCPKVQLIFHKS